MGNKISGVPVTVNGRLVGILTNRDLKFETGMTKRVSEVMTKKKTYRLLSGQTLMRQRRFCINTR